MKTNGEILFGKDFVYSVEENIVYDSQGVAFGKTQDIQTLRKAKTIQEIAQNCGRKIVSLRSGLANTATFGNRTVFYE